MSAKDMTKKELLETPGVRWDEEVVCDSLIIIPGLISDMHDSGYRMMTYIAVVDGEPVAQMGGGSDVLHIGKIAAALYGPEIPISWSLDCLPKSGLLHLFAHGYRIKCGPSLSSFEIEGVKK